MKIEFSRTVPFTPEFHKNRELAEVDQIKTKLKVLSLHELAFVGEVIKKLGLDKDKGGMGEVSSAQMKEISKELSDILNGHVELSGLEDKSGPVSLAELPSLAPYIPLALEIIIELANISSPGELDTKNSKAPPV